jgi:hypothetical protein
MLFNNINRLFTTDTGKKLMSVILGLGLATLFRESCKSQNCSIYKSPPLEDVTTKIYKHNGKCYKFKEESTTCDANKKNIQID